MSSSPTSSRTPAYGWVIVVLAAAAMVATLPGRTHGLGMITERLLQDETLHLERVPFSDINFWATLIGASFCFPAGWMIDRIGLRITSALVLVLLGLTTIAMTRVQSQKELAILITLTRGFGQSALSVVSISMTGKWFRKGLPFATAVYSVLVSIGFMAAFYWAGQMHAVDWRTQWASLGQFVLFAAPVFALLARSAPADLSSVAEDEPSTDVVNFTLGEAIATPAFWVFGIAVSLYGLISSGISLFNESILVERGFSKTMFLELGFKTTLIGLLGNLLTGLMATRLSMKFLTTVAMGLLAGALLSLPWITSYPALICYAVVYAFAGGMITVIFFTVWARLYGRNHLGRIQSIAQMLTVVASAVGPRILAQAYDRYGTYTPAIVGLGIVAIGLACVAAVVPTPRRAPVQNA